jgi:PAS domain S-box-containing protein
MSNKPTYQELGQKIKELEKEVSRYKQVENELRFSEEKFKKIFNNANIIIWGCYADGKIKIFNKEAERVMGYSQEEALGMMNMSLHPPEEREEIIEKFKRHKEGVLKKDLELGIYTKDKKRINVLLAQATFKDATGEDFYVALMQDITERKHAEEKLAMFRKFAESSGQGLGWANLEGEIVYFNPALCHITGEEGLEGVIGKSFMDYYDKETQKRLAEDILPTVIRKGLWEGELDIHSVKGKVVPTSNGVFAIRNEEGVPIFYCNVVTDISEKKRAEDFIHRQRDLGIALSGETNLKEALTLLTDAAIALEGIDCGGIYLRDNTSGAFELMYHKGLSPGFVKQIKIYGKGSDRERFIMKGKPAYLDYSEWKVKKSDVQVSEGLRAIAIIPIRYHDQVIGCLNIASHTIQSIPTTTKDALETIASQVSNAIARLQAEEELDKHHQHLEALVKERTAELTKANQQLRKEITERKQAQEALQESEEKFRLLSEQSMLGIIIVQDDLVKYVNQATSSISEYSIEETLNWEPKEFIKVFHPEDRSFSMEQAQKKQVGKKDVVVNYQMRLISKSGKIKWIELYSKSVIFGGKTADFITIVDINERKQAEEALRESEERFRELVENIREVFWMENVEGTELLYVSPAYEKIWERTCQSFYENPKEWIDAIHPDDRQRVIDAFSRDRLQGTYSEEFRIMRPDGSIRWIWDRCVTIRGKTGEICRIGGIAEDITERKRAEDFKVIQRDLGIALSGVTDLKEALVSFIEAATRLEGVDSGGIYLINPESGTLDLMYSKGLSPDFVKQVSHYEKDAPTTILVMKGEPVFAELKKLKERDINAQKIEDLQAIAIIPIIYHGQVIACMNVASHTVESFSSFTQHSMETIASQASSAVARLILEESLRKEKDTAKTYLDIIGVMLVAINADQTVSLINKKGCEILGYKENDIVGKNWFDNFIPEKLRVHVKPVFVELITGKFDSIEYYENPVLTKSGQERIVAWHNTVLRDDTGKITGTLSSGEDITQRKQAEDALRNALTEVEQLKNRLQAENIYLQDEIKVEHNFEEIISHNKEFKKVLKKVEQVALTNSSVLILGETGTGKELIARAIHNISERKDRPLVKVNCAVLPANLIESELFGHEKGAFTGAIARKIGRFELADGGTIFLDEIGDLPLELQVKLLRVLQEEEFERLGSSHTIKVDVRVIAATNRDLEGAVRAEAFRRDLYYRLNVFPIQITPLRERKDDIPLLVNHFVKKYSTKVGRKIESIPIKVMNSLQAYHWPGNVRELENVLERAVILSSGLTLQLDELFDYHSEIVQESNNSLSLKENERSLILKALEESNWIIKGKGGAAARLDIPPSTLRDRIKTYGIKKPL